MIEFVQQYLWLRDHNEATLGQSYQAIDDEEQYKPAYQKALNSRNFKFLEDEFPAGTTSDQLEGDLNDAETVWRYASCPYDEPCAHCGRFDGHIGEFVVAVDGACRNNGTLHARAAIGVYFGPNSAYNFMRVVNDDATPTSQRAELSAAIKALETVKRICRTEEDLQGITGLIVKTDPAYLVSSMTQHIYKWNTNGFQTSQGLPVENRNLIEYLDILADGLRFQDGIHAFFWHVRREYNTKADHMANMALNAGI